MSKTQLEKYRHAALSALADIRGIDVQYERTIRTYIDLLEKELREKNEQIKNTK